MATTPDKDESTSEQTRSRLGPVAGRAPTVAPLASRSQKPAGAGPDASETGSPGAMEDEQAANRGR